MKNAFTMIEVIFVIVIIGILAAVAIPRLAATREDAFDARKKSNVSRCMEDAVAIYTARHVLPDESVSDACGSGVTVSTSGNQVTVSQALSDSSTFSMTRVFKGTTVSY